MTGATPHLSTAQPPHVTHGSLHRLADRDWAMRSVLALAGFFALFIATTLGARSLWTDEFLTIRTAAPWAPVGKALGERMLTDVHPPLYFLLSHFWMKTFGTGPVGLRSMNLLAVFAFAPLLWLAWRERLMSAARWSLFSLLLLTSWYTWDYAPEARPYIFSLLFSTAQVLLAVYAVRAGETGKTLCAGFFVTAGVLALCASFTHYFGFLLSGGFFCALIVSAAASKRWTDARSLALTGVAVAAPVVIWAAASAGALQQRAGRGGDWVQGGWIKAAVDFFGSAFSVNLPLVVVVAIAGVLT